MEANGRMRSTVARRRSTLGSFYRYCHVEGILERHPAANVRRPKVETESRTLGLDRNELGGLLVQAGLGSARDHALISLLALNGLRISEALGAVKRLAKRISPHSLRHSFTTSFDAGGPLRDVQEAASHADPPSQEGA
jgi:site-specific recombinase XerD